VKLPPPSASSSPWERLSTALTSVAQLPWSADTWVVGTTGALVIGGSVLAIALKESRAPSAILLMTLTLIGCQIGAVIAGIYQSNHDTDPANASVEIGFILTSVGALLLMVGIGLLTLGNAADGGLLVGAFPAVVLAFGAVLGASAGAASSDETISSTATHSISDSARFTTDVVISSTTTQPPLQAGMNPDDYAALVIGTTTVDEAIPILQNGGFCELSAQSQLLGSSSAIVSCDGQGEPGANVQLQFVDGVLSSKSQFGLKHNP
jgi:hypothetical protein